jgi:hypothetical protein
VIRYIQCVVREEVEFEKALWLWKEELMMEKSSPWRGEGQENPILVQQWKGWVEWRVLKWYYAVQKEEVIGPDKSRIRKQ